MKIISVTTTRFRYTRSVWRDLEGHPSVGKEHESQNTLLTIKADNGAEGYAFGGVSEEICKSVIEPAMIGEDAFDREKIWQRFRRIQKLNHNLTDMIMAAADIALWDLCGRFLNIPVYKMLGGNRKKILAYASIMPGDETPGGLSSPEDYANFSKKLVSRGYKAIKLHLWCPPISWAPSLKKDIEACEAVRDAVGPEIDLMLDPHHHYSRQEAKELGRAIEKLDFVWLEEPMNEHSMSSYIWLCDQLDIAILGPENIEGSFKSRAEWAKFGACDMLRGGAGEVGGITALIKLVHLAESFGMNMEVHGGQGANIQVLAAMGIDGTYYEKGLEHPFRNLDIGPQWFKTPFEPLDKDGFVHVPELPGIGEDINFDYIKDNKITNNQIFGYTK